MKTGQQFTRSGMAYGGRDSGIVYTNLMTITKCGPKRIYYTLQTSWVGTDGQERSAEEAHWFNTSRIEANDTPPANFSLNGVDGAWELVQPAPAPEAPAPLHEACEPTISDHMRENNALFAAVAGEYQRQAHSMFTVWLQVRSYPGQPWAITRLSSYNSFTNADEIACEWANQYPEKLRNLGQVYITYLDATGTEQQVRYR